MNTKPNKIEKARLIVQANHALLYIPSNTKEFDKEIKEISELLPKELNELYGWAGRAMSAMRWNTMLAK